MAQYRHALPQLRHYPCLTDAGLETVLIFHEGIALPEFAAFDLLKNAFGFEILHRYYRTFAQMAQAHRTGCVLESPTWRASPDWGAKLGYSPQGIAAMNHKGIALLQAVRSEYETRTTPITISGCIGPRSDGYRPTERMDTATAEAYHRLQAGVFEQAGADVITAMTLTYPEEAIGIVRAAQGVNMPVVIGFTVETDGHLPTGASLKEAVTQVDAATASAPVYYMINCAHPLHFASALVAGEPWLERIGGLRPNASMLSHAELDEADTLDEGNPVELGRQCQQLSDALPNLRVLGGCCGTDHRHVEAIYGAFTSRRAAGRRGRSLAV